MVRGYSAFAGAPGVQRQSRLSLLRCAARQVHEPAFPSSQCTPSGAIGASILYTGFSSRCPKTWPPSASRSAPITRGSYQRPLAFPTACPSRTCWHRPDSHRSSDSASSSTSRAGATDRCLRRRCSANWGRSCQISTRGEFWSSLATFGEKHSPDAGLTARMAEMPRRPKARRDRRVTDYICSFTTTPMRTDRHKAPPALVYSPLLHFQPIPCDSCPPPFPELLDAITLLQVQTATQPVSSVVSL